MMVMQYFLKLTAIATLLFFFSSCKKRYPYPIADFKPQLRLHLERIVEMGIVGSYYTKYLAEDCSISDLKKMMLCEHPLIRATAFSFLAERDSSEIENILLASLNDTAIVSVNYGEFGIPRMYCSDYYLSEMRGKTKIKSRKLLGLLVEKYSDLNNASIALRMADSLPEKYHRIIKAMAEKAFDIYDSNATPYLTYADEKPSDILYALSKYKNRDDVAFINQHLNRMQHYCWKIIQDNPDSNYFNFLTDYFNRLVKARSRGEENLQLSFALRKEIAESFQNFLVSLSAYKSKESAMVFSQILKENIYPRPYFRQPNEFQCLLYDILKAAYCDQYSSLLSSLKPFAENYKKKYDIPFETSTLESMYKYDMPLSEYW
jgi:hypothetical protein